jgi:citrate synthase
MSEKATITFRGKSVDLPVLAGTEDELAMDVAKLRTGLGLITYDPGYMNTGACQSSVTFIDGEKGILRYRGYPIEEIAERSTFLETTWLLLNGELPSHAQLESFKKEIVHHTMLHEDVKRFIEAFPKDAHPMAMSGSVVGALATFYPQMCDPGNAEHRERATLRLFAKLPTIAAYAFKHSIGQPFMYPRNDLSYTANFLHMMFGTPCESYSPDPTVVKALDQLFILHADHEQNCSTSTVRLVGSSQVNLFASISAGISALWGPLHGGANQAVIEMLETIAASGGNGRTFLERCKDKNDTARLMGFGHRVYKNFDPRATIIKKSCFEVLNKLGVKNRLLEIAVELEEMALSDDYFVQRKLYPNVDFYSGIIYQAIGIPVNMFTVMFAIGRLPGWISQWREMQLDPATKIGRPRQIYQGSPKRSYAAVSDRK